MKMLIFSDSHGDVETMRGIVNKEKPDMIFHLGDCITDAKQLNEEYPDIQMVNVLGNVDSDNEDEEWVKLVEIRGKRFMITHGHTFISYAFMNEFNEYRQTDENRATSRISMLKSMTDNNADILLHGHTHEPCISSIPTPERNCWIMNPGSIRYISGSAVKPTYGILIINESGSLGWQILEVE
ncbi:MAG: YfcE family phosphodiesterase [Clostridiales bacterium]|jgi:putative phosphoesterase|nr:YfcE family phosphodiesterase [Clostridiales bacterium]